MAIQGCHCKHLARMAMALEQAQLRLAAEAVRRGNNTIPYKLERILVGMELHSIVVPEADRIFQAEGQGVGGHLGQLASRHADLMKRAEDSLSFGRLQSFALKGTEASPGQILFS